MFQTNVFPQIEDALVKCKDCRWNVADHFTTLIRLRESELRRTEEHIVEINMSDKDAQRRSRQHRIDLEKTVRDLVLEISSLKGMWERLLGTEYPALF